MECVFRKLPSDNPATYCRLCFVEKNLIPLLPGNDGSEHSLVRQISQLIGIQIEPETDGYSSICWRCAVMLEDFQLLRQRSLDHDEIIRNSRKGHAFEIVELKEEHNEAEVMLEDYVTTQVGSASTSSICLNSDDNSMEKTALVNLQNSDSDERCYEGSLINGTPTCNLCSMEFRTRAALFLHCKEQHSDGVRPFQCVFCPAAFKRKGHLERHMETHTGIKRYACNVCDASFARAKALDRHMQRTHQNVAYSRKKAERASKNDMKCPFCDEKFSCDQLFNIHMQSHKDSLPHVCEYCDARFAQFFGLTIHMGKFHPEVPTKNVASVFTVPNKTAIPSQKLDCVHCPRNFKKFKYLKEHLEAVHKMSMPDLGNDESNDVNVSETKAQDEEILTLEIKTEIEETQLHAEQRDE